MGKAVKFQKYLPQYLHWKLKPSQRFIGIL